MKEVILVISYTKSSISTLLQKAPQVPVVGNKDGDEKKKMAPPRSVRDKRRLTMLGE